MTEMSVAQPPSEREGDHRRWWKEPAGETVLSNIPYLRSLTQPLCDSSIREGALLYHHHFYITYRRERFRRELGSKEKAPHKVVKCIKGFARGFGGVLLSKVLPRIISIRSNYFSFFFAKALSAMPAQSENFLISSGSQGRRFGRRRSCCHFVISSFSPLA